MTKDLMVSACAIVALAGLTSSVKAIDWLAAVDGNWGVSANWSGSNIPNAVGEDAVLGLAGMYTVSVTSSFAHGGLSITNPNAVLSLGTITHTLNGDLLNHGTIIVNGSASSFNTQFAFNTNSVISGTGSIMLNGSGSSDDAQLISNSSNVVTQNNGHLIHGAGRLVGTMINNGSIVADNPAAGLELFGSLTQGLTGKAGADSGKLLLGSGSVTIGGELVTANGGTIEVSGSHATIGNLVNSGDLNIPGNSSFLDLNNSITNNGTISVNSTSQVFNAHIQFLNDATIGGNGDVMMTSVGDLGDAQILTGGAFVGTIGSNQTVSGSGLITGASGGVIVNRGVINATDPSVGLGLAGLHMGDGGIYRADDGTLLLRNDVNISDAVFDTSGSGAVAKDQNGVAIFSDITNLGQMNILGTGATIELAGPLVNDGTISINADQQIFNAHLRFAASTSVTGSGIIQMKSLGDPGDAQFYTDGEFNAIIGPDQTVAGSGRIDGRSGGTIINNGTINANDAGVNKAPATELRLQGNHDGSGGGIYRSDDGILGLDNGLVLTGGTFDSSGSGIVEKVTNGVATLSDVTNLGQMGVRGAGGFIALTGPMVNEGDILINTDDQVFNAHLRFDASTSITGSGSITMKSVGNLDDAQLFTDGVFNATIGNAQLVHGSGQIDGRSGGTIVNNGTISGDDPVIELRLRGNHNGSGGGVYRADNGILGLSSGLIMTGGTFDSSGTGSVNMTTNGSATLSGMTNNGTMGLLGLGGIVELAGSLTNNGLININPDNMVFNGHIRFQADTIIDGTGTIDMNIASGFDDAQIIADTGFVGTIGAGQTVTGEGLLVGNLNIDGTLDPAGENREFRIDQVTMSPSSGMIADLGGLAATEFDRLTLNPSDTIALDGTLTVNLDPGYVPMFGDTWNIISGGTITGEFQTTNVPTAGLGQVYRVIYEPSTVYVILTCDADLSGDNVLDFFDIAAFLGYYGSGDVRGDVNLDGFFDFFDIALFLQLYTSGCD